MEVVDPNPNPKLLRMLRTHDFILSDYIQTHRVALFRQSLEDQFPRERFNINHIRVFPHTLPFSGIGRVNIQCLNKFPCDVNNIIYRYLDAPSSIVNAVEFLPVHRKKRCVRAELAVELLDTILIGLLSNRIDFCCPYHTQNSNTTCLFNIYLFMSHDATNIIKNIINVVGKRQAYTRISRCNYTVTGSCMTLSPVFP